MKQLLTLNKRRFTMDQISSSADPRLAIKPSFRGMSGIIRRGINKGNLKGCISISDVRRILPESKACAPDKIIEKSLAYMSKQNEIATHQGKFHTKDSMPTLSMTGIPESIITGKILNSEIRSGKLIATVEVVSLDSK